MTKAFLLLAVLVMILGLGCAEEKATATATTTTTQFTNGGTLPSGTTHGAARTGAMTVSVPAGSSPVVLVLSSYCPTTWTITGTTSRVQSVILDSYYCNEVSGVSSSIVKTYSYYTSAAATTYSSIYSDSLADSQRSWNLQSKSLTPLITRVQNLTGYTMTKAQYVYEGMCNSSGTFTASP